MLKTNHEINRNVIVYSDAKGAVQNSNGYTAKDSLTLEILLLIKDINQYTKLDVMWTKGHNNNTGNEYVDALAKIGAEKSAKLQYSSPYMPIEYRETKKRARELSLNKWQEQWNQSKNCRISKLFYPEVRVYSSVTKMSLQDIQAIVHTATGHGLYKKYLGLWNEIENISCSLCEEDWEDSWHLWEMCPSLKKERLLFQRSGLSKERGIIRFNKNEKIKELLESLITPK